MNENEQQEESETIMAACFAEITIVEQTAEHVTREICFKVGAGSVGEVKTLMADVIRMRNLVNE